MQNSIQIGQEIKKLTGRSSTFVCPCIANIVVNDDQQDATIFGLYIYLFISNELHIFRVMSSPIIRSI